MRLIDVEEMRSIELGAFIEAQSSIADPLHRKVNDLIHERLWQLIDDTPTVEAIPIEWLRERASRMLDFGEGVERIIQEWEKENACTD